MNKHNPNTTGVLIDANSGEVIRSGSLARIPRLATATTGFAAFCVTAGLALAQATVPTEVQSAIDTVEVTFQAIAALAVTIGVFWIGLRMVRKV